MIVYGLREGKILRGKEKKIAYQHGEMIPIGGTEVPGLEIL